VWQFYYAIQFFYLSSFKLYKVVGAAISRPKSQKSQYAIQKRRHESMWAINNRTYMGDRGFLIKTFLQAFAVIRKG